MLCSSLWRGDASRGVWNVEGVVWRSPAVACSTASCFGWRGGRRQGGVGWARLAGLRGDKLGPFAQVSFFFPFLSVFFSDFCFVLLKKIARQFLKCYKFLFVLTI